MKKWRTQRRGGKRIPDRHLNNCHLCEESDYESFYPISQDCEATMKLSENRISFLHINALQKSLV